LIVWTDNSLASLDPTNGHIYWREAMTTSNNDSVAMPVVPANRLLVSGLMLELSWRPSRRELPLARDSCGLETIIEQHLDPVLQGELHL